ncbi:excinuclease ABC subunit UvrA [Segatella albensis]|uniref:excinuclease ABC subunit UvrA n=1 Tax=Segatella albensis TaxID=77768 RepID=UPI0003FADBA7|nr:excinuclease ABC subunit UvrA [Segatella albensis]
MSKNKEAFIEIKGARVNNLKNISLKIPRNKLIVITGVSGSGKSSLAFDTLYAEGQRRYVESLSSYARQFLGRMSKPECDFIKGLPPAIAIEQKVIARNPRSTVGTSTEIYEYLRLLYARIGRTFSPISGQEVKRHSTEDVLQCTRQFGEGTKFVILAPFHVIEGRTLHKQMEMYNQEGYSRIYIDGDFTRIEDWLDNHDEEAANNGDIWLVISRLSVSNEKDDISRLIDSAETAFYEGDGELRLMFLPSHQTFDFSTRFEADGIKFEEPNDNMFSFNSPLGACPTCEGFGSVIGIDEKLVIPNTALSVYDGCVQCWHGDKMGEWQKEFIRRAAKDKFPIFKPYYDLTREEKDELWHGLKSERNADIHDRICIDTFFQMVKENQYKIQYRVMLSRYRGKTTCPDCHGTRLKKEATYVKINGMSITDLVEMPIANLEKWFLDLQFDKHDADVAKRLLTEIKNRLHFLVEVGLGYLTLNRLSNTLSGGESQRINLTTSLGSSLVGSLYILDEPSIGMHSRDTERLIHVLKELQSLGNTVIIVEHDEDMMRAADYIIDIGPNAGRLGGEIVYQGSTEEIQDIKDKDALNKKYPDSYTIKYLTGTETIDIPSSRRKWNKSIKITGARMNNLKGIDVEIPLNVLTVVTGVSGSGKSSLIKGILYPALKRHLDEVADTPGEYVSLDGDWKDIKHVELVDQNPIGKSTRSNPATYVKAYDAIRSLFAEQPLSKQLGFTAQYFSFNADGGRCEECKGAGVITVEMQFMADLVLECEACHGQRFKHDILEVRFHGKNINDVLNMTVSEAIEFFGEYGQKTIVNRLKPLDDVGLGYIKLGQSSSTLSGGENQRVKLAYYIGQEKVEPTLFIFDEPTTGLHFHDIKRLLAAFNSLIERGHSIVVVEHNMDVIKCSDYIIDLGPEGGDKGGNLVAKGTPEQIVACKTSYTGKFLSEKL